jgi:GNAT superfamily N-acetyltransferase
MSQYTDALYRITRKDVQLAGSTLVDAFRSDPMWKAVFENEYQAETKKASFAETPITFALKYGEAYATSENFEGVAAWVPGEYADMTFWRMIRSGAGKTAMRMGSKLSRKMKPYFAPLQMDRHVHMQGKRYAYLQIIGVAQAQQGKGFGGKLLRALIDTCKQEGVHIYLETETEENVEIYAKFGFSLIQQITLPELNLPMWEMAREPSV